MRLIDDLAARWFLYRRPLATMPDVLLIDVPAGYASSSLPLGRYYPVILETGDELREFLAFLEEERPQPVAPPLFDHRPSMLRCNAIVFARYRPPELGWPWLHVCHWSEECVSMVLPTDEHFARGAYSTDVYATLAELEYAEAQFQVKLAAFDPMHVAAQPDICGHA